MSDVKFEIDVEVYGSTEEYTVMRLTTLRSRWFGILGHTTKSLGRFKTRQGAREFVEKVRDLPEYR